MPIVMGREQGTVGERKGKNGKVQQRDREEEFSSSRGDQQGQMLQRSSGMRSEEQPTGFHNRRSQAPSEGIMTVRH